jgi:cell division protein FtsW (lipid II flippase)
VADRAEREDDRNKALDAKITALLAGVVAFIGFSFRLQVSSWSAIAALLYLGPLGFLLAALMTKPNKIAPTAEALVTFFPLYPVQTLRDAIITMERACRMNDRFNDTKARRLGFATALTAAATAVVLVTQCVVALR